MDKIYYHLIVIGSDYKEGKRIAIHYNSDMPISAPDIMDDYKHIKKICGDDIQLSIHKLSTNSSSWESVVNKDMFFKDILVVEDKETFACYLRLSRNITANDLASFILSIIPCSKLKLQKLVYLCYADYLVKYGSKIFTEKIYAYKYGPFVKEIDGKYKNKGKEKIDDELYDMTKSDVPPLLARLVFSLNGKEVVGSCLETLNKYAGKKPYDLVNITHAYGGPWHKVYKANVRNIEITDDIIAKYHHKEEKLNLQKKAK